MTKGVDVFQIEIRVSDLEGAMAFYGGTFEWGIYRAAPNYALVDTGRMPVVGILRDPRLPLGISPLMLVDDCVAMVNKAKDLGGRVFITFAEIAGAGAFTAAVDPWGNQLFFWQPYLEGRPKPDHEPINPFVFVEIATPNLDKATKYYNDLLGWSFWNTPFSPNYAIAEGNGLKRGIGIYGGGPNASGIVCYTQVKSLEETIRKVQTAGGQVVVPPEDFLGEGRYIICADPAGNRIGAIEPAR